MVVGGRPAGRIEAGTAVDIAEMVGGRTAAPVLAGAAVEPGIGVVVVAEDMLGIAVVGDESVAVPRGCEDRYCSGNLPCAVVK